MNYYIADPHFFHGNIIRLCGRPFADVAGMNKAIMDNWNRTVKEDDTIYILGDFSHKASEKDVKALLGCLKGKKVLITGNHDRVITGSRDLMSEFVKVTAYLKVRDGGRDIVLFHYPIAEWDGFYRGAYHFYGHIHNNDNDACRLMKDVPRAYNVGAELIGFCPRTADEIITGIWN